MDLLYYVSYGIIMIEHFVWLSSKINKGSFLLSLPGQKEPINLGDYIEGRFLGVITKRVRPNGIVTFHTFEVLFSANHNETNTLVTWFASFSDNVPKIFEPFIKSKEPVIMTPRLMVVKGWEWYWPVVKELV